MGIIILESPEAMETKLRICIHWVVLFKVYHLVINVDGKTKMANSHNSSKYCIKLINNYQTTAQINNKPFHRISHCTLTLPHIRPPSIDNTTPTVLATNALNDNRPGILTIDSAGKRTYSEQTMTL
jgi:hypothetical protein